MTTTPTSPSRDATPEGTPSSPTVVTAVLFVDDEGLEDALEAVGRQVYEAASVVVVGGGEPGSAAATRHAAEHVGSFFDFVADLPPEVDEVWVLHGDAVPRPDALGALVAEMDRNEASLVGSKILDADEPDRLESVGSATDVFGEPYSGLDPGEVDLEQYDVVRDVAFVSGVSLLVRRDLLKGLRGIDLQLAPVAAGMDLSQRARIAGGRVMVAPSSEVLHWRRCGHDVAGWRELAGRIRAMLKAYRLVTLLWVMPLGFLIGLADGIIRLALGSRRPMGELFRAVGWNLARLPSTLAARRVLGAVRMTGDEELFRFQVEGSVRLRALGTELAERLGWVIDEEPAVVTEEELGVEVRRAGPVVVALVLLVAGLAARRLWFGGIPASGFTLPGSNEALSVLATYAGGWDPSGLGAPDAVRPAPAALALVQLVLRGAAAPLLTLGSMVLGMLGTSRLLRRLGVAGPSRHLAGLVLVLGPFTLQLTGSAHWAGLVAVGGLPWLVDGVLAPWPSGARAAIGRISLLVLSAGLTVAFAPVSLLLPLLAVSVGLPLLPQAGVGSLLRGGFAAAIGALVAGPYLLGSSPGDLVAGGPSVEPWPSLLLVGAMVAAAVVATVTAPDPRWRVAAWGGCLAGLALVAGVLPWLGGEAAVAVVLLGSLGSALAVGAALPVSSDGRATTMASGAASLAATVVVLSTLLLVPGGRAGLPADDWTDRLDFVSSLAPDSGPGRVLLVGLPGSLPGEWRAGNGYAYRLVWGDAPTFDQAWLPAPRLGDEALAATLAELDRADSTRPGARLAPFAIRWVVVLDGAPLADALRAQVDMVELPLEPDVSVFENLAALPRAFAPEHEGWRESRVGASGPAGDGSVRLADNAHPGWGPEWRQDGWANLLSAEEGVLRYTPDPLRRGVAWAAGTLLVLALPGLLLGRRWR